MWLMSSVLWVEEECWVQAHRDPWPFRRMLLLSQLSYLINLNMMRIQLNFWFILLLGLENILENWIQIHFYSMQLLLKFRWFMLSLMGLQLFILSRLLVHHQSAHQSNHPIHRQTYIQQQIYPRHSQFLTQPKWPLKHLNQQQHHQAII